MDYTADQRAAINMKMMNTSSPSIEIESHLEAVRTEIRRVQRKRGLLMFTTAALGGLMVMMAVDYFFAPLPGLLRWGMFLVWLTGIAAVAKSGFAPLMKPIGLLQVARWLEVRHPEMEERISTVMQLSKEAGGASTALLEVLGKAAGLDARGVEVGKEVKAAQTLHKWAKPAIALGSVMAILLIGWPTQFSRLLVRALVPTSTLGNVTSSHFKVKPGNIEVFEGDAVRIDVRTEGDVKNLTLVMDFPDQDEVTQAMTEETESFSYVLNPAKTSFRYQVRAKREESDSYQVTVIPRPKLSQVKVELEFPEYTGLDESEFVLEQKIEAVIGTRVTLSAPINTTIDSAWLVIAGKRVADGSFDKQSNGGNLSVSWILTAAESGEAVIMLKHRLAPEISAKTFLVSALEDRVPEVVLNEPVKLEMSLRLSEILEFKYDVSDDIAVANVAMEIESGGTTHLLELAAPKRIEGSKPARYRGDSAFSVGELKSKYTGHNDMRLRIRAQDGRPSSSGGPGIGYSEWVKIHFDNGAETVARQELIASHDGALESISEAIEQIQEAQQEMDQSREQIKNAELNEDAQEDIRNAGEKLAAAEEKLKTLAEEMTTSVHAKRVDELKVAAGQVAKAREEFENAPMQDDPAQRENKVTEAKKAAEEAIKQLQATKQAMEQERQKIEDLAKIQDMAQSQQELARQAEANALKTPADEDAKKEWNDKQQEIAEMLKQQIRERADAKAEALKAQAAQAKALAEQAKELAKSQEALAKLAPAATPEALAEAIAAKQGKLAAEEQAQAAIPAPAAIDQAAQTEALKQIAEKQRQLKEASETLAKGNLPEALKKLQTQQANEAQELATAIDKMPMVDDNGPKQDAQEKTKQGSQQAQAAAAEGQKDQQQEAAKQHQQAADNFAKSSEALTRAAEEFAKAAEQAAAQKTDSNRAQVSATDLAEAFSEATQAADQADAASAAKLAADAAQALAKAADAGLQEMKGMPPATPSALGSGEAPTAPTQDAPPAPAADPATPPALAKLGISNSDWEKIQATLKSDVGGDAEGAVPDEYRELVKGYFETISKKPAKD